MAAATAKPPQNIAALNIPKAEWKTVWIIAKWHATGAGIYVLGDKRNQTWARCSEVRTASDTRQITAVLAGWLRMRGEGIRATLSGQFDDTLGDISRGVRNLLGTTKVSPVVFVGAEGADSLSGTRQA